jgi:hypothetical protein
MKMNVATEITEDTERVAGSSHGIDHCLRY